MDQNFGGGSKITDDFERHIALKNDAAIYFLAWQTENGLLKSKQSRPSCIEESPILQSLIAEFINIFAKSHNQNTFYQNCLSEYKKKYANEITKYCLEDYKTIFTGSTRFRWRGDKLTTKINRFGHAMDPDRGILFFTSMMLGPENCIVEFQVGRSSTNGRGGYKSLFDEISRSKEMLEYTNGKTTFIPDEAIHIFKRSLNLDNHLNLTKPGDKEYFFEGEQLYNYLLNSPAISVKSLFLLSNEIVLTDANRSAICTIKWDSSVTARYRDDFFTQNSTITDIRTVDNSSINEDLITYCTLNLYKQMKHGVICVSYPGAQGDKCILTETDKGRNTKRTYVDIITYKPIDDRIAVFLTEAKDNLLKSTDDIKKLNEIVTNPQYISGLEQLLRKTKIEKPTSHVFRSIAGKQQNQLTFFDVDYLFMFRIVSSQPKLVIEWQIFVSNKKVIPYFENIGNDEKFIGIMEFEQIYST